MADVIKKKKKKKQDYSATVNSMLLRLVLYGLSVRVSISHSVSLQQQVMLKSLALGIM